jgi:hypothetical protein
MNNDLIEFRPENIEELAKAMYTKYSDSVGGKSWDGNLLPSWEEFSSDVNKQLQANAWRNASHEALHYVFTKFIYI